MLYLSTCLRHLETIAIQTTLPGRPVKIQVVCLSHSRPIIKRDPSLCLNGRLPVLIAGDLKAKHVEWNSRLTTTNSFVFTPTETPA